MQPQPDGRYTVVVVHAPAERRSSDSVTLRAEARDVEGNRVTLTVADAYRLTHRTTVGCAAATCADSLR